MDVEGALHIYGGNLKADDGMIGTPEVNRTVDMSTVEKKSGDKSTIIEVEVNVKGKRLKRTNGDEQVPLKKLKTRKGAKRKKLPVPVKTVRLDCQEFWKEGDYDGSNWGKLTDPYYDGMLRCRPGPDFMLSHPTKHETALEAIGELLNTSLDEVCNGATYVNVDVLNNNNKDGTKMLLIDDNGGGMNPDKMRRCMSIGYSDREISGGQDFMTTTTRLGADVIVFSRCQGKGGMSPTQSVALLSYSFLKSTDEKYIVVPMVDYEKGGQGWTRMIQNSPESWDGNLKTIVQWSPFVSEEDLIKQFDFLKDQGTRIVLYNLFMDEQGHLELDFDTDPHDIQIRGVNRYYEKNIEMANIDLNSRDFLTNQNSLRSYASYLRLPHGFRIILRGKDVDHHNYTVYVADGMPNESKGTGCGEDILVPANTKTDTLIRTIEENCPPSERLQAMSGQLVVETESHKKLSLDRCRSLEAELQEAHRNLEAADQLQAALINMVQKKRNWGLEMRKKLENASNTVKAMRGKLEHESTSVDLKLQNCT